MEQTSTIEHKEEKSQFSCGSGEMPSSTSKNRGPPKSRGKSPQTPYQRQPQTLQTGSPHTATSILPLQKNAMDPATKTHTFPSIETNPTVRVASPHRNMQHPHHRSCPPMAWVEKEPHLEGPPPVFHASSQSHQLSESDNQFSFTCPTSASTPNRTESGL